MKILLENGSYYMQNLGDIAMLQVAISRVREYFPTAQIMVATRRPKILSEVFPNVDPLDMAYRNIWYDTKKFPKPPAKLPQIIRSKLNSIGENLLTKHPRLAEKILFFLHTINGNMKTCKIYIDALQSVDLVICSGGGLINDYSTHSAMRLLDEFEMAQKMGKPTAMFGLGLGPIHNEILIKKLLNVFPGLDVIGLREGLAGVEILKSLNLDISKVIVTGDDAIELAIANRQESNIRDVIGINFRLSVRSDASLEQLKVLRNTIQDIKRDKQITVVALPVFLEEPGSDISSLRQVFSEEEVEFEVGRRIKHPCDLVREVGKCKLVISGSYHSAVFALSQGIPVIALAKTQYYQNKFNGLANQFGTGCKVIDLSSPSLESEFKSALLELLHFPEEGKALLLSRAREQVQVSQRAYRTFFQDLKKFSN